MMWTIVKKEFLSNFLSYKFAVGLMLSVVLMALSAYVLTSDYEERLGNYNLEVAEHKKELGEIKTYSFFRVQLDKPPQVLSILSEGLEKQVGTTVGVSYAEVPTVASGSRQDNPLLLLFPSLDICLVIQVVWSLWGILLGFNAVCGERERGTLGLILCNPIARYRVLLGKYIGGMITLIASMSPGLVIALFIIQASPMVDLGRSEWLRIGIILLCALMYTSCFFVLAICVSACTRASSTSLIALLFIWAIFVIVVPHASSFVASQLYELPSKEHMDSAETEIVNEFFGTYWNERSNFIGGECFALTTEYRYLSEMMMNMSRLAGVSKECAQAMRKFNAHIEPIRIRYAERFAEVKDRYLRPMRRQSALAKRIAWVSPASGFSNVASAFAGTDPDSYQRFIDRASKYHRAIVNFFYGKDLFSSDAFFTRSTKEGLWSKSELMGKWRNGEVVIPAWQEVKPADLSGLPAFTLSNESIAERFQRVIPDLSILICLNFIFFIAANLFFLRSDVV